MKRFALFFEPSLRLLGPLVAWKVAVLAAVPAAILLLPGLFRLDNYDDNFHWPPNARPTLATAFATWDAQHFLFLSERGYQRVSPDQAPSNAFYPLWPATIHVASALTGGRRLLASLVVSNLLSLAALLLFHSLARRELGDTGKADAALLALLAFPSAYVLALPYSESLFLLLAMLLFWALPRPRGGALAALAGLLLPLTRAQGVLAAAPIAVHLLVTGAPAKRWWLALAPLGGFGVYLAVMRVTTGDAFTGFEVYRHYAGQAGVGRFWDPAGFLGQLFSPSPAEWHAMTGSVIDRGIFLVVVSALPALWRMDKALFAWALLAGVVPAVGNGFMSYTRYALAVFPIFFVAGMSLADPRRRHWAFPALAVSLGLQALLLFRHVNYLWAG